MKVKRPVWEVELTHRISSRGSWSINVPHNNEDSEERYYKYFDQSEEQFNSWQLNQKVQYIRKGYW